jgi:hypothetical protein
MVRMVARRWRLRREADVWPSKPIRANMRQITRGDPRGHSCGCGEACELVLSRLPRLRVWRAGDGRDE